MNERYGQEMIGGRTRPLAGARKERNLGPAVLLFARAVFVVVAITAVVLLLNRAAPPPPVGSAAPPAGLGGIGSGVTDAASVDPVPSAPDPGLPPGGLPPAPPGGLANPPAAGGGGGPLPLPPAGGAPAGNPVPPPKQQPPPPPPVPAALRASYATTGTSLTGYQGTVTVTNPGAVAHQSWTVVLTLATGELVTTTSGANSAPTPPNAFTFTASGPIPAHGTQSFTITVTGLKTPPTGCTIDGHPCS